MKDLVLAEILEPEDQPRTLTLTNPHKIQRHAPTKSIKTTRQDKDCKRIVDLNTYQSYPYGYKNLHKRQSNNERWKT